MESINVDALKILTGKIENWNTIPVADLPDYVRASYVADSHHGYGVQCGDVIVLQVRVGERVTGLFGPASIPGDIVIRTPYAIRGGGRIAWKWVPSPDGDGSGMLEYQHI